MASHDSDQNDDEQKIAAAPDGSTDDVSFGLDALGELLAQDQQPSSAPADTGQPPAADKGARKVTLQSALDWYKDWLSSM